MRIYLLQQYQEFELVDDLFIWSAKGVYKSFRDARKDRKRYPVKGKSRIVKRVVNQGDIEYGRKIYW